MKSLSLTLLGPFQAVLNTIPLQKFRTNRVQALLIYLAVEHKQAHRREALMELLWPGLPLKSAQVNLRQTLYQLRKMIPEVQGWDGDTAVPLLLADRHTIQIHPDADVQLDVDQFCRLTKQTGQTTDTTLLETAVALYRDNFLVDFYLPDSADFEEWANAHREAYRRQVLLVLEKLVACYLQDNDYEQAETAARRQLTIDPLHDVAHRQLLETLARSGRRSQALTHYSEYGRLLQQELGVEPSATILALYQTILAGDFDNLAQALGDVVGEPAVAVPTLRLVTLGGFELWIGNDPITGLDTPGYQALLTYLALHADKSHTREQLAFLFWPDSTESQARTNLRKAIYHLRRQVPHIEQYLHLERTAVQWRADASYKLDVTEFRKAVAHAQQTDEANGQRAALEEAVARYQGDFLDGHYDDWVLVAREQLRQQYFVCLEQLIRILEEAQIYPAAISYAQRLLRADPLHETAYQRLMRLQALTGNRAGALRTYHACVTTLQQELGVMPSPAIQEAYERLLQRKEAPDIVHLPVRTPLVAREAVWAALQDAWHQATRSPPLLLLIKGEAGIGKTRLAEEMLDWVTRQGMLPATAACYAAEGRLPFAPVTAWLQSEALQKRLHRLKDKWLVEVSRLLPDLLAERPDLSSPGPLTEGWQRQHLFTALAHTILQARPPLLLFVDDLQWCDRDTLEWLHFLLRFDTQARFLLLGTVRSEEVTQDHPLLTLENQLRREGSLVEIELARLDTVATQTLAAHVTGQELAAAQAQWLHAETEGNPLFIVETARAGLSHWTGDSTASASSLPDKVRSVLDARLGQLSPSARQLVNLAAAIGRSFTFDLLDAAHGGDAEETVQGLDELWRRRIVRERGVDGYDFSHDKLRQAAYEGLSRARRRLLHGRIISALETLHAHNLDEVSGQLAVHYEATGQLPQAISYYQRAAEVSNRVFAHQETMQHLRRAIALLPDVDVPVQRQAELYELLGDVLTLTGEPEGAREVFETAVALAPDAIWQSQIYRKIAGTWFVRHAKLEEAWQVLDTAENRLGEPEETAIAFWWQEWLWIQLDRLWVLYLTRQNEQMARLAEQVRPVLGEYGLPIQHGLYLFRLGMLAFHQDRLVVPDETIRTAQAALTALEGVGQVSQIAIVRFFVGMVHLWYGWHGNLDEAEYYLQNALKEAEEIGDMVLQARCLVYLTHSYRRRGDVDKVREILPRTRLVAERAGAKNYVTQSDMHAIWVAWREGNVDRVLKQGQEILDNCPATIPNTPFLGELLWPLIGASLQQGDIEAAIGYAPTLLEPTQKRMPDALTGLLRQAITAWEINQPEKAQAHLQQALQQAREMAYL